MEELLLQDDDIEEVVLVPPDDGNITDEDSGDEDDINLQRLAGRMLRSDIEVKFTEKSNENEVVEMHVSENNENSTKKLQKQETKYSKLPKSKKNSYTWSSSPNFSSNNGRGDNDETKHSFDNFEYSPVECFELFFSNNVIQLITEMSNRYAFQRNHALNVSAEEIKVYIAILLLTGYMTPKYMRMFWEIKSDTHNEAVANSMRRNRFFEIQQYIHLSDNLHLPENDKYAKVRAYFNLLNNNFTQNFEFAYSSHISMDETMIPYYGRHSLKQHIHGKPIRFGYKMWSAATRDGYLITFEPYQGAKAIQLPLQNEYGLGAAVILELESRLPKNIGPYNLYFDNFFTGLQLLATLTERGTGGTGTIRENRTGKCPITQSSLLKKEKRGSFSFKTSENVLIARWNDNNIVTFASNCHNLEPIQKVDRIGFVNGKRAKIQVDCPSVVRKYNKYMGGVDRFDENVASMRISLRGKKWWFPLFAFGVDAACQNAWLTMKACSKQDKLTYCQFRRTIVQVYLSKYSVPPKKRLSCGVPLQNRVIDEVRLGGNANTHTEQACSQRRCVKCHKATRKMCVQCNVALHVHCWFDFHCK